MEQTVLAAGGHNAVWLFGALGHKVVDEGADVAVRTFQNQRLTAQQLQRRVDTRHKALHRRFLIAGGAVELPCTVEPGDLFCLQGELKLSRVDAVIFDGVGRAEHFRVLQTGHGVEHGKLHILRQAGGKALQIHFVRVQAARLQEQLVAGLVGKADDFCLDAGTVARPDTGNGAVKQGTAGKVFPNDLMGLFVGVGQIAHGPVFRRPVGGKRERLRLVVARLQLHLGKIDASGVDAGRCAGLEAAQRQSQNPEIFRQLQSCAHTVWAGGNGAVARDNAAVQIGSCRNDAGTDTVDCAQLGDNAADGTVFRQNLGDGGLLQIQIGFPLQKVFHMLLIAPAVSLCPERVDSRAFAPIEHPILDAAGVGGLSHFTAQSIQLSNQMTLAGAADGGIAWHIAHRVEIDGEYDGTETQSRGGETGLDAGMTGADHSDIIGSCGVSHWCHSFRW